MSKIVPQNPHSSQKEFRQLLDRIAQAVSQGEKERQMLDKQAQELYKLTKNLPGILRRNDYRLINEKVCPEYNYEAAFNEALSNFIKNCQRFLTLTSLDSRGCSAEKLINRYIGYFNAILINASREQYNQIKKQTQLPDEVNKVLIIELIDEFEDNTQKQEIPDPAWLEEQEKVELEDYLISLKEWLENDCSREFQKTSLREHPDCSCQRIALELLDNEGNITKVAKKLKVNYKTLHEHWKENCIRILRRDYGQK